MVGGGVCGVPPLPVVCPAPPFFFVVGTSAEAEGGAAGIVAGTAAEADIDATGAVLDGVTVSLSEISAS
jgi:hypothetical protein